MSRSFSFLLKPVTNSFFWVVLIFNLLSNYVDLKYHSSFVAICCIFFLSAAFSYLESSIYCLLKNKWLRILYVAFVIVFHNFLVIAEYFLLTKFQMIINQDAIDILAETNPEEASNFFHAYSPSIGIVIFCVCLVFVINKAIWWVSNLLVRLHVKWTPFISAIFGFCILLFCVYNFVRYRNGMSIPQYTTVTRSCYALYNLRGRLVEIRNLKNVCSHLVATQNIKRKPLIVTVIGESFSVYHSSLYGYEKNTNPLLSKYAAEGSLVVFDNVVSLYDGTHGAMRADFSLDSLGVDFANKALFPACFKAANYHTRLYDNQYFVGNAVTFLSDKGLSETMFDFRNEERYRYDGLMVDDIQIVDSLSMYVIHLWGQHYTYSERYPKDFRKFKPSDYSSDKPLKQREVIADYDNATLYNDYVLAKIFEKFKDQYCCIFYFSDHGEEVYELSDYMGHGNAAHSSNLNYQLRVPLMVWFSPSFLSENQDMMRVMQEAKHYPICTDDIGHSIIDVAGIRVQDFKPSLSFVNSGFNKHRQRIVLNSVNYDKDWVNKK
jgi:heptose-I-phosphate ethanolaminephosphotransferase